MISVVIPTYNRAQFLAETIESVLAQVYREFEVIVIDDGSTDNTAEVVARFGDKVRYVPQPNSERAVSRNHGLRLATGEFLAFLDSDDCWEKQALIEMVKSLRANPAAAFTAVGCSIIGADNRVLSVFYPGGGVEGVLQEAFYQLLRTNVIGSPSAVLLRRSALERWGSFDEDRGLLGVEDWELWARLAFHAPIVCRRWPLVRYRRHFSNTPLATMRLRYPSLAEALLRNLSLPPAKEEETRSLCAQRLAEYAEELSRINESAAAAFCAEAAKRLHHAAPARFRSSEFRREDAHGQKANHGG